MATNALRAKSPCTRTLARKASTARGFGIKPVAAGKFDAAAHVVWLRKLWGHEPPATDSGKWLAAARADRVLTAC
jgi:hypothetical protein